MQLETSRDLGRWSRQTKCTHFQWSLLWSKMISKSWSMSFFLSDPIKITDEYTVLDKTLPMILARFYWSRSSRPHTHTSWGTVREADEDVKVRHQQRTWASACGDTGTSSPLNMRFMQTRRCSWNMIFILKWTAWWVGDPHDTHQSQLCLQLIWSDSMFKASVWITDWVLTTDFEAVK